MAFATWGKLLRLRPAIHHDPRAFHNDPPFQDTHAAPCTEGTQKWDLLLRKTSHSFEALKSITQLMKRILLILPILLLAASPIIAGAFLEYFQGRSEGDNVVLEWKTRSESNVRSFEVVRKAGAAGDYVTIATVEPRGGNATYQYVDRSAYKESGTTYTYRLKINDNGSTQVAWSNEVSVSPNVSSVKRTWGSIKAMFR